MRIKQLEKHWNVAGIEYGFVYKWTDNGRNRYYIGSHWGKFNDRYVCSSPAMRKAHRRRPEDFTRRILAVITTNRIDLLAKEQTYLDKIPRKDFGVRAYNVSTKTKQAWWAKGSKVIKKAREKMRARWQNPERKATASRVASERQYSPATRTKMSKAAKLRSSLPEAKAKFSKAQQDRWQSQDYRDKMSRALSGRIPWNQGITVGPLSKSCRKKIAASLTGIKRSQETKAKDSEAAKQRWLSSEYRAKITANRNAARRSGKLKITLKQAAQIRRMYATGKYTISLLSSRFYVSDSYIHNVIHSSKWNL